MKIRIKKHIDPLLKTNKLRLSRREFYSDYCLTCQRSFRMIGGFRDLKAVFDFLLNCNFDREYIIRNKL